MKSNNLTIKQENFCQAYIRLGDKSAAYREAYSTSNMKANTIHRKAQELFNNGLVTARIKELQSKVAVIAEEKFKITTEDMLRHLDILRKARIDEYIEFKKGKLIFKDFDKLSEDQLKAIEGIKQTKYGIEIKLHGKEWSMEKINRHIGFYEKDNEQSKTSLNLGEGFNEQKQKRLDELIAKATGIKKE